MVMQKIYEEIGKKAVYSEEIQKFNRRVFNLLKQLDSEFYFHWGGYDNTTYKKVANLIGDAVSDGGKLSTLTLDRWRYGYEKALEENIVILKSTLIILGESNQDLPKTFVSWLEK